MKREQAEALATEVLIWLAGRPEDLAAFLATTGAGPGEVRARARDPEFLGFVLDHLLGSDALVLAFAADSGRAPTDPARARALLPGGYAPDWT
jgi:hypothetical protein